MTIRLADPELQAWLDAQPPYAPATVAQLRAANDERARQRPAGPRLADVSDLDAGGVPARLYVPAGDPAPLLVYLHGGGWTVGSLESHDPLCRTLADGARIRVLSLDYRLSPEHRWPASIEDAVAALRWAAGGPPELGGAPGPLAVGGDSAGGCLAALACQRLRVEAPEAMPAQQVLLSPNADLWGETESMREKATGLVPDVRAIYFYNRQWVPDPFDWRDPGVSPLRQADLSGLPPALVVTAEHDPLRDEGEAYARTLAQAGVTVTLRRELGVMHDPVLFADISPTCAAILSRIVGDVAHLLHDGRAREGSGHGA